MNQERIRELAREAGLLTHNPDNRETKLDKFAQLLIQECIGIARQSDNPAKEIGEYFGIKS